MFGSFPDRFGNIIYKIHKTRFVWKLEKKAVTVSSGRDVVVGVVRVKVAPSGESRR